MRPLLGAAENVGWHLRGTRPGQVQPRASFPQRLAADAEAASQLGLRQLSLVLGDETAEVVLERLVVGDRGRHGVAGIREVARALAQLEQLGRDLAVLAED